MELIECIKTRRSIRQFSDKKITENDLKKIIEISRFTPSWKNSQTTRYIGILDNKLIKELADNCLMDFEYNIKTVKNAPAIVVITTVNKRSGYERNGSFSTSKGSHWQSFDAGISTQTFCLAAHNYALSTVIIGIFDEAKILKLLDIPQNQSISALVAIGYGAEEPIAPPRKATEELLIIK